MNTLFRLLSPLLIILSCIPARSERPDSIRMFGEVNQTISSGDHTPFWLVSNRQGLSSIEKDNGYIRFGVEKRLDESRRFSWGATADFVIPWKYTSHFVVQQLFGEIKYRSLGLFIGAKEMWSETCDRELSSGGLLYSGDARPIPQVRAGMFDYEPLKFTNDWISIKGYLAYGAFTDSDWQRHWAEEGSKYTSGVLYCSRGLWFRNGDSSRFPLIFTAGIEMATQFAGTSYNHDTSSGKKVDIKMPSGPMAWLKAFIPLPGGSKTIEEEQTNVEGNMIGVYDFALSWESHSDWKIKAYWQHMFEDHSQLWIDFPWKDGLWGVQGWLPKNPYVASAVVEFLYSKFQSGPVYNDSSPDVPEQVSGVDGYYTHYLYSGWQHWGMGIGNPFSKSPIYNSSHLLTFTGTRNISYHFAVSGSPLDCLKWKVLLSNTRSWGAMRTPYPEVMSMWNFLAQMDWSPARVRGLHARCAMAFDTGDFVGKSLGVEIGIGYDLNVPTHKKGK